MNKSNAIAALAAMKSHERRETDKRTDDKSWKPYPCLLSRSELQKLIAEQLG